jgi:superfamily II DNA or RNA helicase
MHISTYGYGIPKSSLSKDVALIKKELTIMPFSINNTRNRFLSKAETFPVYRETSECLYMPIYYGLSRFGIPTDIRLSEGQNIDVPFNGELRDYQAPVIEKTLNYFRNTPNPISSGLLELPCAWGKTGGSLYMVSQISKKTLVIVHKTFLMNQWIERIAQFLPTAKVGRIQGSIFDIEGKDIVLCMLQSLSMKEYTTGMFSDFGFTIIDEVHHISSQTFSCALFKVVTKYMIGLTATLVRKDGTTPVIKMFLGDVIYKGVREERLNVKVDAYHYYTSDPDFNTTAMDWKGNPMYSTMITKLCNYSARTEFILDIIKKIYAENPNQQIMVLAHNKSVLAYIYNSIEANNICDGSVGYYIGGMKEEALKISETKKIIIATYSMAAEALDIKTLTTLVMATPKTDIEQAVGRIMRDRHSSPLIVDIVDQHGIFLNQWKKRKTFYKSNKYDISEIRDMDGEPTPPSEQDFVGFGKCLIATKMP